MQLIVLTGLPASGKTTFYREHFLHTHVRLSLDLCKTREREDILLHACLAAKQPVVIDNTNATVAARKHYLDLARSAGFKSSLYFVDVNTRQAVAMNSRRTGKSKVPNVAIFGTQKKLERPSQAEGYDEIFRVVPSSDESTVSFSLEPCEEIF